MNAAIKARVRQMREELLGCTFLPEDAPDDLIRVCEIEGGSEVVVIPLRWSLEPGKEIENHRGMLIWPADARDDGDWLVHFYGWGAASSQVTLRFTGDDQKWYSTLIWRRSGRDFSAARAISDLIETQGLYEGRVDE